MKINPSRSKVLEFEANVGEIVTVKISFSHFIQALLRAENVKTNKNITSNRSIISKTMDNEVKKKKSLIEV